MLLALLALMLGVKHSYDTDHLVAVSGFLTRTKSLRQSVRMSSSWAFGHMLTASALALVLYFFQEPVLAFFGKFAGGIAIPIMLIALGLLAFRELKIFHRHEHSHDNGGHKHLHIHFPRTSHSERNHYHKHMFGIGIVHGLASNGELLLLLTVSLGATTIFGLFTGVAIFSVGVAMGMIGYGVLVNTLARYGNIKRIIVLSTGMVSIAYGAFLLLGFPNYILLA